MEEKGFSIMRINRRTIFGAGAGALIATLFPEIALADGRASRSITSTKSNEGEWFSDLTRPVTDDERSAYMQYFEDDLSAAGIRYGGFAGDPINMSIISGSTVVLALSTTLLGDRVYIRRIRLSSSRQVLKSTVTVFDVDTAENTATMSAIGTNALSAVTPASAFAACGSGTHSCRTCTTFDTGRIVTCCGGCVFTGNVVAFTACAMIFCSLCMSQNCLGWTYACCSN